MNATDTRDRDLARALLDGVEVQYPGAYGAEPGTSVDLGDGRTATLRVVFDDHAGIGRWIGEGRDGHHDDVFGTFAWRGRDSCYGYPAERPAGFDGRARVLVGDSRGDRWDGPVWWQPTDDDADPAATLASVRAWMRGDWFHVGLVVTVDGPGGSTESTWGVEYGDGAEVDAEHLVDMVADLLVDAGLDVDPFDPSEFGESSALVALLGYLHHVGADEFACDVARRGMNASTIRWAAGTWRRWTFEPPEFADRLDALADRMDGGLR